MSRPARPASWPWWAQVLAVHGLARLVSGVVLVVVARTQAANPWTPASPSYLEYTGLMWDAGWYREIAETGYPVGLPRGADGAVQQNAWAFFPVLPLLVRTLMTVTGAPWHVVAPLLALVAGAAALLVVHRLVSDVHGDRVALVAVAVLTTSAASPVLQVAYTESLALLLLATALLLLRRRLYLWAVPVTLLLGLTRAVALGLVVAVAAHALGRLRAEGRGWPVPQRVACASLAVAGVLAGLAWPTIVGWATGEPDAYLQTQASWRARLEVVPLLPWFDVSRWLLGDVGPWVVLALVVLVVVTLLSPPGRRLGPEMLGWTAGYLGYLLVVVEPGTSLVRFLLLAFPLAVVAADLLARRRLHRGWLAVVLLVGTVGQVWWVAGLWRLVPPSGWPP